MRNIRIRNSITHQLAPLFRRISRVHNRTLEALGLRAVDAHILVALWDGPMTVSDVQRRLGIRGSTLTGALDRLEKRELLRRAPREGDRRVVLLFGAKWPKARKEKLYQALERAEAACFGRLSQAERAALLRLVTKANEVLVAQE